MWLDESIIYQIYPLGITGAPIYNDNVLESRISVVDNFIDHIKNLGVNCVYFSPLFESDKHGYDTRDYFKIDSRLGTNEDFKRISNNLHNNGIRVILDGVFNHVGRGFYQFQDVLKNRENSRYKDWFFINFQGNSNYNDGLYYEGWEGHYELVKLNLFNNEVVEYIFSAIKYWVDEFNIDGLRLDVAYCLDKNFLRRLRGFANSLKPEFVLIGEILFGDYKSIVNNEMLYSCTNYEGYKSLYSAFNSNNLYEISYSLNRQFGTDPWCIYQGLHLLTFLDNHDVSRIASILTNKDQLPLAFAFQMTIPGIPCIYYGSEWGILGEKKDGDESLRPQISNPIENDLYNFVNKFVNLRKNNKCLIYGNYKNVVENNKSLVFSRSCDGETIIVALNISDEDITINSNKLNFAYIDLLTNEEGSISDSITLDKYSIKVLKIK